MPGLELLTFLNPWALAALLVLPVIYWLLRFTPPKPQSVKFPPFRLLLDLISNEEDSDKTPWWLVLLRLALAATIIIAIAQPVLTDNKQTQLGKVPLLVVLDNDWSSANDWQIRQTVLLQTLQSAKTKGVPVAIVTTTPGNGALNLKMQTAGALQTLAANIQPQSLKPDYPGLLKQLKQTFGNSKVLQIRWLSNGRDAPAFRSGLKSLANGNASLSITLPATKDMPIALGKIDRKNGKITATMQRQKTDTAKAVKVSLLARNGRTLARASHTFKPGETTTKAAIDLPLALRNEAARIVINGQNHAAAVRLFDDRWRRKSVGIVSGESLELAQPLLSPLYYVSRALSPIAQLKQRQKDQSTADMLKTGLSMLVLADIGVIAPKDRDAIENWVTKGGVLVRFAGPRLADNTGTLAQSDNDRLIPVRLRRGGRALGSALSWEQPQGLAPFAPNSPLAGLSPDPTVKIRRQVLAEPGSDLSSSIWASLADGTPLITAKHEGLGLVVLVHVTANSDWSNLPLTGLFVEILKRIVDLAPAVTSTGKSSNSTSQDASVFVPQASLNGFGKLVAPPPGAKPVRQQEFAKQNPTPDHPAGMYRAGSATRAINLQVDTAAFAPVTRSGGNVQFDTYTPASIKSLAAGFFILAFLLLLTDTLATLFLMGGIDRIRAQKRAKTTATICLIALIALSGVVPLDDARAQSTIPGPTLPTEQDRIAMQALTKTRFAYVRTGDARVDATSLAGLEGLNLALKARTSVDPGAPQMVDLEKDEIVFYPILYWPVLETAQTPSDAVIKKLGDFMRNGGTIFFDTRDQNATFTNLTGNISPATRALRRILAKIDIPALEPVPPKHVLTRAFYLMQHFPGRWLNGKLWVEASTTDKSQNDGVSSIIIGANDYASAWAIDTNGRPLYATIPGTPRQREFAYRTGINIVMYSLTGNYKADQVHVPALLERLGE